MISIGFCDFTEGKKVSHPTGLASGKTAKVRTKVRKGSALIGPLEAGGTLLGVVAAIDLDDR